MEFNIDNIDDVNIRNNLRYLEEITGSTITSFKRETNEVAFTVKEDGTKWRTCRGIHDLMACSFDCVKIFKVDFHGHELIFVPTSIDEPYPDHFKTVGKKKVSKKKNSRKNK